MWPWVRRSTADKITIQLLRSEGRAAELLLENALLRGVPLSPSDALREALVARDCGLLR